MRNVESVQIPEVAAWRKARWLTQQEVANRAGVTNITVSRAERGVPIGKDTAEKILAVFGLSYEQFRRRKPPAPMQVA